MIEIQWFFYSLQSRENSVFADAVRQSKIDNARLALVFKLRSNFRH